MRDPVEFMVVSHRHKFTTARDAINLKRKNAREALRRLRPDVFIPLVGRRHENERTE